MAKNVKITTKISPFDIVCPHYCMGCGRLGSLLCECCKNYMKSEQADAAIEKTPGLFVCGYRKGLLGKLVEDYKYKPVRGLSGTLAGILDEAIPCLEGEVVIVPLPTVSKHIRARGFDHMDLIARKLGRLRREQGWRRMKMLSRANNSVQVGTDASTRRKQAETAYEMAPRAEVSPEVSYLLLDDVWTTGASMGAAEKILREAGAKKVYKAVVAKSGA